MRVDKGHASIGVPVQSRTAIPIREGCMPDHPVGPATFKAAEKMLHAIFGQLKQELVRKGFENLKPLRLEVSMTIRDTDRHFAACRDDGRLMVLAPDVAVLPARVCMGIIQHEFGHAVDFCYPGQLWLTPNGIRRREVGLRPNQGVPRDVIRSWENRDDDLVERTADAIAEQVFGVQIGYCGPCRLQTLLTGSPEDRNCSRPRPVGLR